MKDCPHCNGTGLDESGHSNCCDAPIYEDMGICTDCKEHCEEIECDQCNGTGKVEDDIIK